MHQCGSLLMHIVVLLKLFNMLYAQLGPTMERINYSILFYSFAVFRSYLFKEISSLHKIISTDNKKNYNMILSCYKKGRATVFTDINF